MDIYSPPESRLEKEPLIKKPNVFWRIFFWVHFFLILFVPVMIVTSSEISIFDYIDLTLFPFILLGLYSYGYAKPMFSSTPWRILFRLYIVWVMFYEVVAAYVLKIPAYGEVEVFDWWVVFDPIFILPTLYVLFQLSRDRFYKLDNT